MQAYGNLFYAGDVLTAAMIVMGGLGAAMPRIATPAECCRDFPPTSPADGVGLRWEAGRSSRTSVGQSRRDRHAG